MCFCGGGGGGGAHTAQGSESCKPDPGLQGLYRVSIWVVVEIMAPLWVPIIIRHLLFRVPKRGP